MGDVTMLVVTCLVLAFLAGMVTVICLVLAIRVGIGLEKRQPKTHRGKQVWQPPVEKL